MNIVFDIIGSLAIRGAIVLVILQLNLSLRQTLQLKTANANVRQNLGAMISIIETDFRQLGYNVSGAAILALDTSDVKFVADFKDDGAVDTVRIYLSGNSVYRKYSTAASPVCLASNVKQFRFDYYDITGVATSVASDVKSVTLKTILEDSYEITVSDGQKYKPTAKSENQFYPANL